MKYKNAYFAIYKHVIYCPSMEKEMTKICFKKDVKYFIKKPNCHIILNFILNIFESLISMQISKIFYFFLFLRHKHE